MPAFGANSGTINENGCYNAPNTPEDAYRYCHVLSSPIFMLTVTAIISIGMKPESIAEFEFPAASYWQIRLKEKLESN